MKSVPVQNNIKQRSKGLGTTLRTARTRFVRRAHFAYARTVAYLTHMQWPQWLTLAVCLASAVLWLSIWRLDAMAVEITAETRLLHDKNSLALPVTVSAASPLALAPPEDQYLNDLKTLFSIAKHSGVIVGTVDYKREPNALQGIVSRHVALRVADNYPHMKEFIARVLKELPHVILHELRIERNDPLSPQALMLVRFSLIYEPAGTSVVVRP